MDTVVLTSEEELQRLLDDTLDAAIPRLFSRLRQEPERPPKEVLSNKEAMEFLDVSKSTLHRWRDDGTLPYSKIGASVYYEREHLLRVVREHRVKPANS